MWYDNSIINITPTYMKKRLLMICLAPAFSVMAQTPPAPQFQGQPGPAAGYPAPTGAPQFQGQPATGAPQFPGQHAAPTGAPHHPADAPHIPGQHGGPGAYAPAPEGASPDHDEIVGTIIGIDEQNQLVRIMTKTGPVALKVTEDSELLIPGDQPEALLEIDPEDFKRESKGKMLRIASRNGKIDHIEPAN